MALPDARNSSNGDAMDPVTIHISTVLQTPQESEDYVTQDVQLKSKDRVMWASNLLKILGLIFARLPMQ